MRYFFVTVFLLGFFALFGQSGNYFLSHYSPHENQSDNVCFDIVQDTHGLVYFATRSGIMQFDGRDWNLIAGHGAIYSLQLSKSGDLYWAGASGYGKVTYDDNGLQQIQILSQGVKNVFQSLIANNKVYFINEEKLFFLSSGQEKATSIKSSSLTGYFRGMFELYGMVYVNTEHQGILKVANGKLVPSTLGFSGKEEVVFAKSIENHYWIGLSNNKVFYCGENLKPREIKLEDQSYVNASVIVNGTWVNKSLFVLGTLRGGMIFVQATTGKTQEIINYTTGLPDNEVFALMRDKSQCIWAAHEYGFTRVAPYLPFRSFSHYSGLQGNLLCARAFDDDVYAGTSLGLYKLEKEDVYEEIIYYADEIRGNRKEPVPQKEVKTEEKPQQLETIPLPETESKRKGFLRFLRKGGKKSTAVTIPEKKSEEREKRAESSAEKGSSPARPAAKPVLQKVKKIEKVLRTSQYVYKKVQGVDAKITQLLTVGDKLIAVGLGGTYEITGLTAKAIVEEPTRFVFAPEADLLFIATYADRVKVLTHDGKNWVPLSLLDDLHDQVNFMFHGQDNEVWLCALDKIYRIEVADKAIGDINAIDIDNPNFDEFAGIHWNNEIMLANTQGIYRYERTGNRFSAIDSLSQSKLLNYFSVGDNILYRDTHGWNLFGRTSGQRNLRLLNLFQNLRFISADEDFDNLWIITGSNELYKFFGERFIPYEAGHPVILKTVRNDDQKTGNRKKLKFDQEKSSLRFEVIQPDYLSSQSTEYRYQLKGLDKEWTTWSSTNNTIDFPYLPSGNYALKVQSRDIFRRVKDMQIVSFKVLPPYWQRPWFYALEFFVFALLVLLSFRLSTKYRIISKILSWLTIIMLIQFIQTIIVETFRTKTSPVMDFFVQVLIAFLILPVEGYLRSLMPKSLDSHSVYRFITPKRNLESQREQEEP